MYRIFICWEVSQTLIEKRKWKTNTDIEQEQKAF